MDEAGVDRAVIVPPSWPGDRNDYGLEAVERHPHRFAVMGRIPLEKPESAALLAKWKQQPGMLGVRLTFHRAQSALLESGTADWFWPAAEKAGLPVMFLAPGNTPKFAPIAERHPQLPLIIDHMNLTIEIAKARAIKNAVDEVVALAKYPNVSVKLSSAPTYSLEDYPWRDMTEPLKRCFDAFGPQRCYWGTDLTNAFSKSTYRQRITHFTEQLGFLSEKDKDWVMGRAILARLGWA
jgi:predicted TIM-barrel fold metal-dependent hydrolase